MVAPVTAAPNPNARVFCRFCQIEHRLDELANARREPWPGVGIIVGECPRPVAPGETRGTLVIEVEPELMAVAS